MKGATGKRCKANYGRHPERSEGSVPVEKISPYGRNDTHPTGLLSKLHYPVPPIFIAAHRNGFLDLEKALILFLLLMSMGAVFAGYRVWSFDHPSLGRPDSWLYACQSCMEQLNQDVKFSRLVSISSSSVSLKTLSKKDVTFSFTSDYLVRDETGSGKKVILSNLEKGFFSPHPKIPGLLSMVVLSKDKKAIPFLTSFFSRGREKRG